MRYLPKMQSVYLSQRQKLSEIKGLRTVSEAFVVMTPESVYMKNSQVMRKKQGYRIPMDQTM